MKSGLFSKSENKQKTVNKVNKEDRVNSQNKEYTQSKEYTQNKVNTQNKMKTEKENTQALTGLKTGEKTGEKTREKTRVKTSEKINKKAIKKTIGVVRFPGTNCDRDIELFVQEKGFQSQYLWHNDLFTSSDFEAVIIPGGFSYGDYLRAGALSARSPVMASVREFADQGRPILGICNGFQILTESGLLPGALVRNENRRFIDAWVELRWENAPLYWDSDFRLRNKTKSTNKKLWRLPIAHGEGRFYAPSDVIKKIQDKDQVWLKYVKNPNGSLFNIAGVMNKNRNVVGLMPHPERALFDWMQ